MKSIQNSRWLDTHQWGVRGFNRGHRANHNGFQFNPPGVWTECPDWNSQPKCGGGFHLMTPKHCGFGVTGTTLALVEWRGEYMAIDADKAKVSALRIIPCSDDVLAEALTRCGILVASGRQSITVPSGPCVTLTGAPRITQSGGDVCTYGISAPRIKRSQATHVSNHCEERP